MFWKKTRKEKLTILLAEDNSGDVNRILKYFSEKADVLVAETQEKARELLSEKHSVIDIFVLDGAMPGTQYNTKDLLCYAKSLRWCGWIIANSVFWNLDLVRDGADFGLNKGSLLDDFESLIGAFDQIKELSSKDMQKVKEGLTGYSEWDRSKDGIKIISEIISEIAQ